MTFHVENYSFVSSVAVAGMADLVRDRIDAHASWEFVETVTSVGTPARKTHVLHNIPGDFYLHVFRAGDSAGNFALVGAISEGYDPATKKASKIIPFGSPGTLADGDGVYSIERHVTDEIRTGTSSPAVGSIGGVYTGLGTASGTIYLSITADRVMLAFTTSWWYLGLIDPWPGTAYPFSKHLIGDGSAGDLGATRSPTGQTLVSLVSPTNLFGNGGRDVFADKYRAYNPPVGVGSGGSSLLGRRKDFLVMSAEALAVGEDVVVGGETYTAFRAASSTTAAVLARKAA